MKKMQKILCMLLALAMLLSFAACAAKEAAPSTTDTPAADAADAKTETKAEDTPAEQPAAELPELTLMLQTSDESNGLLAAVDYVNAHAEEIGAKLILEKVPDGDQGEQVIQVRYAGGEDVPDILYFQPVSYTNSRLSVADNFVDLTANDYSYLYSDSYLRTPGYLLDGKLYNLPIATGGGMYMFYNKDVLAASGITEVPTTWDAFLVDCEAIKANGISPVYYSGVDTWTLQFFALMGWYSDYAPEDAQAFADAMSTNQKHWSDMNASSTPSARSRNWSILAMCRKPTCPIPISRRSRHCLTALAHSMHRATGLSASWRRSTRTRPLPPSARSSSRWQIICTAASA